MLVGVWQNTKRIYITAKVEPGASLKARNAGAGKWCGNFPRFEERIGFLLPYFLCQKKHNIIFTLLQILPKF